MIFICSAKEDNALATRLCQDLKKAGFTPWMADHDVLPGQKRELEIKKAVRNCHAFLALISSHSAAGRGNFQKEMKLALAEYDGFPEGSVYLIPVLLDGATPAYEQMRELETVDLSPPNEYADGLRKIFKALELTPSSRNPSDKINGLRSDDPGTGNKTEKPPNGKIMPPRTEDVHFFFYPPGEPIFENYVLKRPIGEGGFGRVYLVESRIGKSFALKVLFRGVVGEKRGVESVLRIRSNRLVNVLDYGETAKGEFCVLMEYMKNNFAPVMAAGKIEENKARHWFREILEGLDVLERHRIIHRDIKPSNLFLHEDIVKIGDFGTARITKGDTSTKTRTLGTFKYCAPEVFGNHFAFSADRWAAAVIFYRMLTGGFPFGGEHSAAVMGAILVKEPDWSGVSEKYAGFLKKCFEKDPSNRFADAREMIRAFEETGSAKQQIREFENRIMMLEAERDMLKGIVSENLGRQGDSITIQAGGNVAFAKDQAEARAEILEKEINQYRRALEEKNGADKTVTTENESGKPKKSFSKPMIEKSIVTNIGGMAFVYVEPGTFMMGSPEDEPGRFDREKQHRVTLTKGFYMQTTPVTQGQYEAVTGTNPSRFKDGGPECPVETVSWKDAQAFIKKLNEMSAHTFRLPTEAEWEYACRAGTTTPFHTGNCLSSDTEANYDGNYPLEGCPKGVYRKKTTPVGTFPPNAWGLYDMHGNVWEWCEDWYDAYPSGDDTDPTGPFTGSVRVLRGGSWGSFAGDCRSAYRYWYRPGYRDYWIGFRLVCLPGQ